MEAKLVWDLGFGTGGRVLRLGFGLILGGTEQQLANCSIDKLMPVATNVLDDRCWSLSLMPCSGQFTMVLIAESRLDRVRELPR